MKTVKWLGMAVLALPLLVGSLDEIQSNGAPAGHTNAPGELTCNRSGCHTGHALNSGGAVLTVDLGGAVEYSPGMVYPVRVEIAEQDKQRFGFQVLAWRDDDATNAGTFILTDSARTKITAGINQYAGRSYATYRFPGTSAVSPGVGRWDLLWQAPAGTASPVTFYTAAAVADNDGTDQGDFIYTKTLTLSAKPVAVEGGREPGPSFSAYPNPGSGLLTLSYDAAGNGVTGIHLQDLRCQGSIHLARRRDPPGRQTAILDLRGLVPAGNYLLCISQGQKSQCQTIIITP